jgi:hypothetical protein
MAATGFFADEDLDVLFSAFPFFFMSTGDQPTGYLRSDRVSRSCF